MTNLTNYGSSELSMWVQNDEFLYTMYNRALGYGDFSILKEAIDEMFIYTHEQLVELEADFETELSEQ